MSLLGALNTADSGLTAQSSAFTNISDNIANSQTVGYKSVTTSFADYLTSSTATENMSGAVETTPQYQNDLQGTITQSSDPLALAISGQGFFNVSETNGINGDAFNPTQYFTRDGDFTQNARGYLVNGSGDYLDGYNADPVTGAINFGKMQPIKVDASALPAVATSNVTVSASLPANAGGTANGATSSSDVAVYDAGGGSHEVALNWTPTATPNQYSLSFSSPDIDGGAAFGTATATFNANGTLASVVPVSGGVSGGATGSGAATLSLSPNFGSGGQPISLNLGTLGSTQGVTIGSTATFTPGTLAANGSAAGNFTGVSMTSSGDVVASYDNSQTRVIAHVPLATFAAPDALQRQNGQAFTATEGSGVAKIGDANQGGVGQLVTGSVESSNVDISTDLTRLISAQQAYGANAKMVTAANQMMQTAIAMVQQ